MKGKGIIISAISIFFLVSCSNKIKPEKPLLSETNFKLDSLPESEINIPIQVNLKPIYQMAEKNIDTVFTSTNYPDDWIQEGCDVRYKYIFRRGPLQMKARGTNLELGFTGYYKIIGSTRICVNGVVLSSWTPPCRCGFNEGERKVNVGFTTSVNILPDYKARLLIQRKEPEPVNKCEVCFWGQDITKQVMNGLKLELDAAKKEIEESYGLVDLKPQFQKAWDELNKTYSLYGLGWLQINPKSVRLTNIFTSNDTLNLFLGLSAKPVISFEKPQEQSSWIPNIGYLGRGPGFNIFLDALMNYDSLSNILNTQLKGKQFDLDKGPVKKTFIVKKCSLFGSGNEKLIIRVDFEGSNEGTAYFTGKPEYNEAEETIEFKDLDFDIRTKNAFLKTADWLFNKKIVNELNKYARFDLSTYFLTAKVATSQQLNQEWKKGIRGFGGITDIKLIGIYPLNDHLVIRSSCSGQLSVIAENIDFSY